MPLNCRYGLVMFILCWGLIGVVIADEDEINPHWAILIGINDYVSLADLNYSVNDQAELAKALKESGFPEDQIVLMTDQASETRYQPTKANIEKQLNLILPLVRKGDLILIAFSGHGAHFDKTSFLCPSDADLERADDTLIPLETIYSRLDASGAEFKLILIDACRNDPRPPGKRTARSAADANRSFAEGIPELPRGSLLLTSCEAGEQSQEDPKLKHGVFMHYLLRGLEGKADENKNDKVSVFELYEYAQRQTGKHVARVFNDSQHPRLRGELSGSWEFATIAPRSPQRVAPERPSRPEVTPSRVPSNQSTTDEERDKEAERLDDYEEWSKLEKFARDWIEEEPENPLGYYWLSEALSELKQLDQAMTQINTAIRLAPDSGRYRRLRGGLFSLKNDFALAIQDYNDAIRMSPDEVDNYLDRSDCHQSMQNWEQAMSDANIALRMDPSNPLAYYRRAAAHGQSASELSKKDAEDCMRLLNEKIKSDPENKSLWRNLQSGCSWSGDHVKNIEICNTIITKGWGTADTFCSRGVAYDWLNHRDQAVKDYTEAIRRDATKAEYFRNRGSLFERMDRDLEAVEDLTRAIQIDPQSAYAFWCRGIAHEDLGNSSQAEADKARSIQLDPKHYPIKKQQQ